RTTAERALAAATGRHEDAVQAVKRHAQRAERLAAVIAASQQREQNAREYLKLIEKKIAAQSAAEVTQLQAEARALDATLRLERQVKLLEEHQRQNPVPALEGAAAEREAARARLEKVLYDAEHGK